MAEHLKQPLYRLGAGYLGSEIGTVEERLGDALPRYAAWNAVPLNIRSQRLPRGAHQQ